MISRMTTSYRISNYAAVLLVFLVFRILTYRRQVDGINGVLAFRLVFPWHRLCHEARQAVVNNAILIIRQIKRGREGIPFRGINTSKVWRMVSFNITQNL
jgi:hypothetical protein